MLSLFYLLSTKHNISIFRQYFQRNLQKKVYLNLFDHYYFSSSNIQRFVSIIRLIYLRDICKNSQQFEIYLKTLNASICLIRKIKDHAVTQRLIVELRSCE